MKFVIKSKPKERARSVGDVLTLEMAAGKSAAELSMTSRRSVILPEAETPAELSAKPVEENTETPPHWWEAWDETHREAWKSLGTKGRAEFRAFHEKENLCRHCQQPIDYVPSPLLGGLRPNIHSACGKKIAQEMAATHKPQTYWDKHCPFQGDRKTNLHELPDQQAAMEVINWQFSARGIVAHGVTGKGKTRAVWQLIKRLADESRSVFVYDAVKWGDECGRRFDKRTVYEWLELQVNVDVLFIDDLDKAVFTQRVQAELFSLFKARCENGRPTFFTTNLTDEGLRAKFDVEVGAPFVERMLEH